MGLCIELWSAIGEKGYSLDKATKFCLATGKKTTTSSKLLDTVTFFLLFPLILIVFHRLLRNKIQWNTVVFFSSRKKRMINYLKKSGAWNGGYKTQWHAMP